MNSFRLKSFLMFLSRNKLYAAINLFGFAVSLAVVILLGLYIKMEYSVDSTLPNKERIYRITNDRNSFAPPILGDIKSRYPDQIEAITRITSRHETIQIENEILKPKSLLVDSSFFSIFEFPFLEGNPAGQLRAMEEVTITKSFATKVFGSEPALGKSFRLGSMDMIITGVIEDLKNSHFQNPDIIMRFEHMGDMDSYNSWFCGMYVKTIPGSDLPSRMPDLMEHFKTYAWTYQNGVFKKLDMVPLSECYWDQHKGHTDGTYRSESIVFIHILMAAMIAILLFAAINYINLSVAQSGFRAKEAATRRLLGSSQRGLFSGFILESVIFCAGAFMIGVVLAELTEPFFNQLLGADVSVNGSFTAVNVIVAIATILLLGLVCGAAPAWAISQYKPIDVVRGTFARKTKMLYGRGLIILQYLITIVLLGATITIMRQTSYMRNANLGFNKENIVYLNNSSGLNWDQAPALRDKLALIPGVDMVSFGFPPLYGGNNNTMFYDDGTVVSFQVFWGDSLYMKLWGIETLSKNETAAPDAIWINETAVKELNLAEDATTFKYYDQQVNLAGVVKDFHIYDFSQTISPVMIGIGTPRNNGRWIGSIQATAVKISGLNQTETYKQVKDVYAEFTGHVPFDSGFIDEKVNSSYDSQQRTYTIIGCFALIAFLISALGMLAMATYFMRQRTAEIAIRKVFGSTDWEVLRRVIISFMRMVAIAFVLAVPVIWYAMSRWLEGYAYRITLSWTIFALAGLAAFFIAFVSVFWQCYKATRANPVDALKR